MRSSLLLGLAVAGLATLSRASSDFLFFEGMTYNEHKQATTALNMTGTYPKDTAVDMELTSHSARCLEG